MIKEENKFRQKVIEALVQEYSKYGDILEDKYYIDELGYELPFEYYLLEKEKCPYFTDPKEEITKYLYNGLLDTTLEKAIEEESIHSDFNEAISIMYTMLSNPYEFFITLMDYEVNYIYQEFLEENYDVSIITSYDILHENMKINMFKEFFYWLLNKNISN